MSGTPSATDPIVSTDQLQSYLSGDPDLYVNIASAVVRGYCHWHIWPQIKETIFMQGSGGMTQHLPTLRAVQVENLVVDGKPWEPHRYDMEPSPANQIRAKRLFHDLAGYLDYTADYANAWGYGYNVFGKGRPVTCELTHGYADVPGGLQALVLNIAARAQGMPSTWLRSLQSEDYRYEFVSRTSTDSIGGFQLTADDINQMAAYWIPGIA